MDKIYTARDRAIELGFTSYLQLLESLFKIKIKREFCDDKAFARIDHARWIADCPSPGCKGSSYVDPELDGFWCSVCKNTKSDGNLLHVIFPEYYKELEEELLKRVVIESPGMFGTQAAIMAEGLPRSWDVGETIEDLEKQRLEFIEKARILSGE